MRATGFLTMHICDSEWYVSSCSCCTYPTTACVAHMPPHIPRPHVLHILHHSMSGAHPESMHTLNPTLL